MLRCSVTRARRTVQPHIHVRTCIASYLTARRIAKPRDRVRRACSLRKPRRTAKPKMRAMERSSTIKARRTAQPRIRVCSRSSRNTARRTANPSIRADLPSSSTTARLTAKPRIRAMMQFSGTILAARDWVVLEMRDPARPHRRRVSGTRRSRTSFHNQKG